MKGFQRLMKNAKKQTQYQRRKIIIDDIKFQCKFQGKTAKPMQSDQRPLVDGTHRIWS